MYAILAGSQDALSEIIVYIHFLEVHVELTAVHVIHALPQCQQPIVGEVPFAHGEVLEHAKTIRYLLLDSQHATKTK